MTERTRHVPRQAHNPPPLEPTTQEFIDGLAAQNFQVGELRTTASDAGPSNGSHALQPGRTWHLAPEPARGLFQDPDFIAPQATGSNGTMGAARWNRPLSDHRP